MPSLTVVAHAITIALQSGPFCSSPINRHIKLRTVPSVDALHGDVVAVTGSNLLPNLQ